ncbi:hypothetical protein GCM10009126_27630 [Rhodanobacter caeni]|uniref:Uncharacterized protein n=1 Tax=Rhodanobacter caeni TaxID=657654 RepID=A0ABN0UT24_9GAMM
MKIALPTKDELGRWMTGGAVIGAANLMKFRHDPDFWWLCSVAFGSIIAIVFLYLTARANIYALIRRRQGRKISRQ